MFQNVPPGSSNYTITQYVPVKRVNTRRTLAVLLLTVMLFPVFLVAGAPTLYSFSDETNGVTVTDKTESSFMSVNYEVIAEKLIQSANYTYGHVNATLESLSDIEIPPVVREQIQLGVHALLQSKAEFQKRNHTAAARQANEAMNHFGVALRHLYRVGYEEVAPSDEEVIEGMKAALERALVYLDKINASIIRYDAEGYDVFDAKILLEEAKNSLERAEGYLEEGDVNLGGGELGMGREILEKIKNLLNGLIRIYKEKKVEQYVNQFAVRVQNINQTIASISSSVMLTNSIQVQNAIRLTNQNLQLVRSNIQLNVSIKLTDLKDMVDDFEDNLEGLNGNGTGTKLNEMNKVIANIQVMQNSAARLISEGLNATSINSRINKTEDILEEMRDRFKDGDLDDFEELIEEAKKKYGIVSETFTSNNAGKYINRFVQSLRDKMKSSSSADDSVSFSDFMKWP